jgi:hypothetical protein
VTDQQSSEPVALKQALAENVRKGHIEIIGENEDGPIYRMTEAGKRYVEEVLLGGDPS